jgi:hypothetical protein
MSDRDLLAIGFSQGNDGVLHAPSDSRTTLAPTGQFYELRASHQPRRRQRHRCGALKIGGEDYPRGKAMSTEQTPEGAHEIVDRLERLTPETHKAMDAIRNLIDQQHMRAPIAISALTWTLADLMITSMSPPGCGAALVGGALQKIVEKETGSKCPGTPHDGHLGSNP